MPASPNRLDLATRRGITAQAVIQNLAESAAERTAQRAQGSDSIVERIGNAALAGLLQRLEEDGALAAGASANGGGTGLKEAVEAFRTIHEVTADQDDRRHRRYRELEEENEALRQRLQAQSGGNMAVFVELIKILSEGQQRSEERIIQLIERIEARNREMLQELRQQIDRSAQDAPKIERLLDELRQASDPVSIVQKVRALREAFGLDNTSNHAGLSLPLELLPEYWRTDIERLKVKLAHERDLKAAEAAERRAAAIEGLLKEVAQARSEKGPHAQTRSDGAGRPAPMTKPPSRYRYRCDACGKEFILGEQVSQTRCPYCQADLEVVVDDHREAASPGQPTSAPHPERGTELAVESESG